MEYSADTAVVIVASLLGALAFFAAAIYSIAVAVRSGPKELGGSDLSIHARMMEDDGEE